MKKIKISSSKASLIVLVLFFLLLLFMPKCETQYNYENLTLWGFTFPAINGPGVYLWYQANQSFIQSDVDTTTEDMSEHVVLLLECNDYPNLGKLYVLAMQADMVKSIVDTLVINPTLSIHQIDKHHSEYIFTFPNDESRQLFATFMHPPTH